MMIMHYPILVAALMAVLVNGNPSAAPSVSYVPSNAPSSSIAPSNSFAPSSSSAPSNAPSVYVEAEYEPGNLNTEELDLTLSKGLTAKIIARSGEPVTYSNGTQSSINFHTDPDGASVYKDEATGGWTYVSNSETDGGNGGVFGLKFDASGNIIEYKALLTGTSRNCNGGRTDWGAWISCEEAEGGRAWQVDPSGVRDPVPITIGSQGGFWESFSHDTRDKSVVYAFLTEDDAVGAVRRMTLKNPDYNNPWEILLQSGPVDFLMLKPDGCMSKDGTFEWTTDEAAARENAEENYPYTEGMEMDGDTLRIISKELNGFFTLNLDAGTYTFEEVEFDCSGRPDQSTTVIQDDGSKLIYFTEEAHPIPNVLGAQVGIYTRDEAGEYKTILNALDYSPETTGVSFSPDGMYMYFAFQQDGIIFQITRTDGLSFFARKAAPSGCGAFQTIRNAWNGLSSWLLP